MSELEKELLFLNPSMRVEDYYSSFLLSIYQCALIYLMVVRMARGRIGSSSHRSFLVFHVWSLPFIGLLAISYRVYSSWGLGYISKNMALGMALHLCVLLLIWFSCMIDWVRELKRGLVISTN